MNPADISKLAFSVENAPPPRIHSNAIWFKSYIVHIPTNHGRYPLRIQNERYLVYMDDIYYRLIEIFKRLKKANVNIQLDE